MLSLALKGLRIALLACLGAAAAAKILLESHAEADSQDIDLIAIFGEEDLVSRAEPFYGGKVLAMFGLATIDLTGVTPAPTGVVLDVITVFGRVEVVMPARWRVRFDGTTHLGTYSGDPAPGPDPDRPLLVIRGRVIAGALETSSQAHLDPVPT